MKILFVFTNIRYNEDAVEYLLKTVEETKNANVYLYFVPSRAFPRSVASWIMYMGVLGEKLTEDIKETLRKELLRRGEETLEDICGEVRKRGGKIEDKGIIKGELSQVLNELYERIKPDMVIIPEEGEALFDEGEEVKVDFKFIEK